MVGDQRTLGPQFIRFGTPFVSSLSKLPISTSSSGDNILVAGQAGQLVHVYRMILFVSGATNITFKDGASTALSGSIPFSASGGIILDMQGEPWYDTSAGNGFVVNSSNAVNIGGTIYYVQA